MVATTNLVPDPGFESGSVGLWTPVSGFGSVAISSTDSASGTYNLRPTANSTVMTWRYAKLPTRMPVVSGGQYYMSVDAKAITTAGYSAGLFIYFYASSSGGSAINSAGEGAVVAMSTSVYTQARAWCTAPAGANYAEVRLYAYQQPISLQVRYDNLVFGPAALLTGNYLSYPTQSMEIDVSLWLAQSNTTAAVSTTAQAGTQALQLTATGAGDASAVTSENIPVVAGRRYLASGYFRSGSGTPNGKVEIQYYTAGHVYISSSNSSNTATSSGAWTLISVGAATAPPTADYIRIKVYGLSLSAAQIMRVDQVVLTEDPVLPSNLLTAGEQTIDSSGNDTLWVSQANATLSRTTSTPITGAGSLLCTSVAAGASRFGLVRKQAVTADHWYSFQVSYRTPTAAAFSLRLGVDWYDAGSTYLSTSWGTARQTVATGLAATQFDRLEAPPGAVSGSPVAEVTATAGSQAFRFDQFSLTDTGTIGSWSAVVDAEHYSVDLAFTSPAAGGVYPILTVWRTGPDGLQVPVRGQGADMTAYDMGLSTLWTGTDYEAPAGVPVSYTALWQGTSAEDYQVTTDMVTVPAPADRNTILIKHPGRPVLNLQVMAAGAPSWERAARRGEHPVRGRRNPIVVSDVRGGYTGTLDLFTWTDSERQSLGAVLDDGAVLLFQAGDGVGWDGNVYASVGDVSEGRLVDAAHEAGRRWVLPLTVVDRPSGGLQGTTGRTWQDVADDYLSWQAVMDQPGYTSWLDVYLAEAA